MKDPTEAAKAPKPAVTPTTGLPAAKPENTDKKADAEIWPTNTPEAIQKLASAAKAILEVEGGMKLAEDLLTKQAGQEAAKRLLDDLTIGYGETVKLAHEIAQEEYVKQAAIQEAEAQYALLTKNATQADLDRMAKTASAIFPFVDKLEHPLEKLAAMQGAEDAAAMEDAGAFGEGPEAEAAALPGAEGALSLEQLAQILAGMVQSGQVPQKVAEDLLNAIAAGGDPAAAGAPVDPAAGGAPVDPAMAAAEGAPVDPAAAAGIPPEVAAAEAAAAEGAPVEAPLPETEEAKAASALLATIK